MNTTSSANSATTSPSAQKKDLSSSEWSPFQVVNTQESLETQIKYQVPDKLYRRYGPCAVPPPVSRQLASLTAEQRIVYGNLKSTWQTEQQRAQPQLQQDPVTTPAPQKQPPLEDALVLRVARFCDFDFARALDTMKRLRPKHWNSTVRDVSKELKASQACVILPGLTTQAARDVVYVYLSRLTQTTCPDPLRVLTYTLNACYQRYSDPAECKLALIINLQGYHISDEGFQFHEWVSLLELLQGQAGPIKATRLLLVNAESEFQQAWDTHLVKHCQDAFQWRLSFVPDGLELMKYLNPESEQYMPTDFPQGSCRVKDLVRDFCDYRRELEHVIAKHGSLSAPCKTTTKGAKESTHPVDKALDEAFEGLFSHHVGVDLLFEASGHQPTSLSLSSPPPSPDGRNRRGSLESVATAKAGNTTSPLRRAVKIIESPNSSRQALKEKSPQRNNSPSRVTRRYKPIAGALGRKDIEAPTLEVSHRPPSPARMSLTREASARLAASSRTLTSLPDAPLSPSKSGKGRDNVNGTTRDSPKTSPKKKKKKRSTSTKSSNKIRGGSVITVDHGLTDTISHKSNSTDGSRNSPRKKGSSGASAISADDACPSVMSTISKKSITGDGNSKSPRRRKTLRKETPHMMPNLPSPISEPPRTPVSKELGSSRNLTASPSTKRPDEDILFEPVCPGKNVSSKCGSLQQINGTRCRNRQTHDSVVTVPPRRGVSGKAGSVRKMNASPSKNRQHHDIVVPASPRKNFSERSGSSRKLSSSSSKSRHLQDIVAPTMPQKHNSSRRLVSSPSKRAVQSEKVASSRKLASSPSKRSIQEPVVEPSTPKQHVIQDNVDEETYSPYSPSRASRERMMGLYHENEIRRPKCVSPKKSPKKDKPCTGVRSMRWQNLDDIQSIPDIEAPVYPSFNKTEDAVDRSVPERYGTQRGIFRRFQSMPDIKDKNMHKASASSANATVGNEPTPEQPVIKVKSRRRIFNRMASLPNMDRTDTSTSTHTSRTELSPSRVSVEGTPQFMTKRTSLRNLFRKAFSMRTIKGKQNHNTVQLSQQRSERISTLDVTQEE